MLARVKTTRKIGLLLSRHFQNHFPFACQSLPRFGCAATAASIPQKLAAICLEQFPRRVAHRQNHLDRRSPRWTVIRLDLQERPIKPGLLRRSKENSRAFSVFAQSSLKVRFVQRVQMRPSTLCSRRFWSYQWTFHPFLKFNHSKNVTFRPFPVWKRAGGAPERGAPETVNNNQQAILPEN